MRSLADLFPDFLADLRQALVEGAARDAGVSPDAAVWLARWALVAALVGTTLFLFCGYHAGFVRLNGLAARTAPWVWEYWTLLGDERVAFALALFFCRRRPRVFWTLIVAALVATAYSQTFKHLFSALRPPAVLDAGDFNLIGPGHRRGSFPSGHTVTASVFFAVWVYYIKETGLRLLLIILAVLAGLSRVALGVHWPVDVAAGMLGGVLAAWIGAALARRADWGVQYPSVHLAFAILACFPAAALLMWDGGHPETAGLQTLVGLAALGFVLYQYLIRPAWRRRHRTDLGVGE